jgi:hypothetical protein
MAREYVDLLLPVGRMVFGQVDKPRKILDAKTNQPVLNKDGTPREEYAVGHAIAKGGETHWNQTQWGAQIWAMGQKQWPNGQFNAPTFAWKITDGDSQVPNKKGNKPCDREGYPGHWVLALSNMTAPQLTDRLGKTALTDRTAIVPGRYVQPFISMSSNESTDSPGLYLNLRVVALSGWGEDIVSAAYVDPSTIGFGGALPAGASELPQGQPTGAPPASQAQYVASAPPPAAAPAPTAVTPNHQFANPGAAPAPAAPAPAPSAPPPQPQKRMTAKAVTTYDEYIKAGWSDEVMIREGVLEIA